VDGWLAQQVTLGNVVTVVTAAASFGYQLHRLAVIERDVIAIKVKQENDARSIADTYERRDVLAEVLKGFNRELVAIHQKLSDMEKRL